jgi:hypothetical protein
MSKSTSYKSTQWNVGKNGGAKMGKPVTVANPQASKPCSCQGTPVTKSKVK